MSMFTVTGEVLNVYHRERTDKKTNETEQLDKVQILGFMPVQGGDTRREMIDLTCDDYALYSSLEGKTVSIPLGFFSPAQGQIVYFIPKGAKPVLVDVL